MIKVQHISKCFGTSTAVRDVSFEAKDGEVLVLLGTSGCGKTTTLKMLNRLLLPTQGDIFIEGHPIADQPIEALRKKIGYVLQNHGLFPHYTVQQNIAIVPTLLGWDSIKIRDRVLALMDKLHLPKTLLNSYPDALSGGQQQRTGLARALAADPPILLMDEPFGALDDITKTKIHREFLELDELKKKTIIMVTHDIQEAFFLGNHICLMDGGSVVQDGSPADLVFSPKNSFVSTFLQEQRLQLEFKAYKMADIWRCLPAYTGKDPAHATKGNVLMIKPETTIWRAMELLTEATIKSTSVTDPSTGDVKVIDFATLVTCFYNHTRTQAHG